MREIIVNKAELIGKLESNLEKYKMLYTQVREDFFDTTKDQLQKALEDLEKKEEHDVFLTSSFPRNQEHNYHKVIGMLKMHIEDKIVLDEREYSQYILNEWDWKASFIQTANRLSHYRINTLGVSGYSGPSGASGTSGLTYDQYTSELNNF